MFGKRDVTKAAKKGRIRIHEVTTENDIRFLGPLTYQHFKLLGWLCLAIAQVAALLSLGGRFDAGFAAGTATLRTGLESVAELALPFLLIANFAQILDTEEGYRKQLLVNGAATAGICAAYYLLFYRYFVGGVEAFLTDPSEAMPAIRGALALTLPYGFFAFNLFIDLFLCTLAMLFLNYNPRRIFKGKSRILFRLLALLPIGYEVGCMLLKVRCARGLIQIPLWAFPLLTVKPPMTFVLFVALALFVKTRELRFRRHGKTHEEYRQFLKTRRNAWNFSVFLAVMLVIVGVADLAVTIGFSLDEVVHSVTNRYEASLSAPSGAEGVSPETLEAALAQLSEAVESGRMTSEQAQAVLEAMLAAASDAPALTDEEKAAMQQSAIREALREEQLAASLDTGIRLAQAVGFGSSICMILLAPLALLFSYTRKPKNRRLDLVIPAAGVLLIVLVYLEGTHQLLGALPIKKVNLRELEDMAVFYASLLM